MRISKRALVAVSLVVVLGALFLFRDALFHGNAPLGAAAKGSAAPARAEPPPAEVEIARVEKRQWQPYLETVGSVVAVNGVTVSTDLGGRVIAVNFESGAEVAKGALLVQLDVDREVAQLAQAQAKRDLSRLNLDRQRNLLTQRTIPQSEYDSTEADFRQNDGAVAEAQAIIDKKTIRARFDGVLGIRQVNVGQWLAAGQPIVTLQSVDPVHVDFNLPQAEQSKIVVGRGVEVLTDAYPEPFHGTITALNSEVEQDSRYLKVRATVPNSDRRLRPGMFAKVNVQTGEQQDVTTIPLTAIRYAPYGDSVYVVIDGKDAAGHPRQVLEQRFVKLGATRGEDIAVDRGVQPGERVVKTDVFRLRNGVPVTVRETKGDTASVTASAEPNHS